MQKSLRNKLPTYLAVAGRKVAEQLTCLSDLLIFLRRDQTQFTLLIQLTLKEKKFCTERLIDSDMLQN